MSTLQMLLLAICFESIHLLLRRRIYGFSILQCIVVFTTVAVAGVIGALVSHYIEWGYWGIRYYGAVFVYAIALLPVARWIGVSYSRVMNYVSPEVLTGIVVMKISCYLTGCCYGKIMSFTPDGIAIRFPSQIVEWSVAVIIMAVVTIMEFVPKFRRYTYPVAIIGYSTTRMILDTFRADQGRVIDLGLMDLSVVQLFCGTLIIMGCIDLVQCIKSSKVTVKQNCS